MEDKRFDNDEAADYLKIHPSTLATWRWQKKSPPYYKYPTNGKVFYLKSDLDEWLKSGKK